MTQNKNQEFEGIEQMSYPVHSPDQALWIITYPLLIYGTHDVLTTMMRWKLDLVSHPAHAERLLGKYIYLSVRIV